MKIVLALCALLFAAQANAATYRYEFQVKLIEEVFYRPFSWSEDDPNGRNSPGTQKVTFENNPYSMSGYLSALRDGQWHDGVVEFTADDSGTANVTECTLGSLACNYGYSSYYISSPDNLRIGNYWDGQKAFYFEFGEAGMIEAGHDSIECEGIYQELPIDCNGYQAFLEMRVPITSAPVPAGGILLLTGLAGISLSRRLSSRRHPQ